MTLRVSYDVSAVPARPAGAGRYTVELATALAARDSIDLRLLARTDDAARWAHLGSVHPVAPVRRPLRLAWEQAVLPRRLRSEPVDLHHGPHYTMPEASRLPKVVTVHDCTFFDHPEWHERSKVLVFRRAIRVAARHAGAVVCPSQETADALARWCEVRAPVTVVPHGVDHRRFTTAGVDEAEDDAAVGALGVRAPYVGFVGTIEPRKDVPTLIEAFDRIAGDHPDLSLVIAGQPGWGGDAFARALAAARHRDRVVTLGYVDDAAVPALLRRAAAIAYPSLAEGFGLPALEAMACGAPLVTTEGTAMAEVAHGAALLVPAGSADRLAGALDEAVTGGAGAERRRLHGIARAAAYTWEACADGHVQVFRSAVSAPVPG